MKNTKQSLVLLRETNSSCIYCGRLLSEDTMTRDHIRAACQGGADAMENLVAACGSCNVKKAEQPISSFVASFGRVYQREFEARVKGLVNSGMMPEYKGRLLLEKDNGRKEKKKKPRMKSNIASAHTVRRLALETESTCIYCGRLLEKDQMDVDLILDPSLGGKVVRDNMVLCCKKCKGKKLKRGASGFRYNMEADQYERFRRRVHQLANGGHISAKKARALLPHSKDLFDLRRCWKIQIGRLRITFRWDKKR